ncbi:hypothetical protein M407DRAFT_86306 [Tulasnella calospora MUT 4182]|uniref:Uncharacterized protein n=1 Tax=Tulasnella calospora MUT 4182 TaxID=1051891 RepID=A0A0C3L364_9AGAM|nr:hypothetical protein M407DRAFT_86306 [Tulasnella calospora MUT 4182]
MPCNRESSTHDEYVPALCTHRPSLFPIEWLGEAVGASRAPACWSRCEANTFELGHLEEVQVVTRFP